MFGLERLLRQLGSHANVGTQRLLEDTLRAVRDYCGGDMRDDVAMLAVVLSDR